jgi:hypothetical protein
VPKLQRSLGVCFCDNEMSEGSTSEVESMQFYQAFMVEKQSDLFCIVSTSACEFGIGKVVVGSIGPASHPFQTTNYQVDCYHNNNRLSTDMDLVSLISVEGCEARNFTRFSNTLLLELKTSTATLTDSELVLVSQIALETFNELN